MSFALSSPLTGAAVSGLTSPTYTLSADVFPDSNGEQLAATALGGTQTNVSAHTVTSPFTISCVRPKVFKTVGVPNPVTGRLPSYPRNVYKIHVRKGVVPYANQPSQPMLITCEIHVPAGAEVADYTSVQAAWSMFGGAIADNSAGFGDIFLNGLL